MAAAALPSLLAYNVSPSPTFLNQALALALWGLFAAVAVSGGVVPGAPPPSLRGAKGAWPLLAALVALALAALWSWRFGALPKSLALSAAGTLLAASVMVWSAAAAAAAGSRAAVAIFTAFCWGWAAAGLLNAGVAAVQVFAPAWADGDWIARSGMPGRAVGNLRQPNHLSSLLLWAAIAVVALAELQRIGRRLATALLAVVVLAVVLTASRTGVVGVVLMAVWGAADRRLSLTGRRLLLAAPLLYMVGWLLMAGWSAWTASTFGGQERLAEADLSSSRFAIWADTWRLIQAHPWAGVGFGEFNFAWSLSVMPRRPTAFFDHTHNLPLQLAVELGLPLAGLVMAMFVWALWRAWRSALEANGALSVSGRCAIAMLVLIGVHSQLEYPLWYSYFLLPAAWVFGLVLCLPARPDETAAPPAVAASWRAVPALAVVLAAAISVADYMKVVAIFSSAPGGPSLERRIADGRQSLLFAHHADYAAATVSQEPAAELAAFAGASHFLLDTRLMMAWAQAYAQAGDLPRARYLAQRLREFRNPNASAFFAECQVEAVAASGRTERPFQCDETRDPLNWRDFLWR